jgi:hypothetical protein
MLFENFLMHDKLKQWNGGWSFAVIIIFMSTSVRMIKIGSFLQILFLDSIACFHYLPHSFRRAKRIHISAVAGYIWLPLAWCNTEINIHIITFQQCKSFISVVLQVSKWTGNPLVTYYITCNSSNQANGANLVHCNLVTMFNLTIHPNHPANANTTAQESWYFYSNSICGILDRPCMA